MCSDCAKDTDASTFGEEDTDMFSVGAEGPKTSALSFKDTDDKSDMSTVGSEDTVTRMVGEEVTAWEFCTGKCRSIIIII